MLETESALGKDVFTASDFLRRKLRTRWNASLPDQITKDMPRLLINAFEMGSAPAAGAVAGASPATIRRIKDSHRSVNGDAAPPTGEGAGWMRPGRARSPFLAASLLALTS